MSLGLAGLAAAIGGGMWGLLFVLVGASRANAVDLGFAWTPVVWIPIVLIAGLTLLAALGGLSARQFQAHRRSIWVASLLPVAGIGIMFFGLLTLIPSGGAADEGSIQALVLSGGIVLMLIGSLVFAAVTFAIGALSRVAAGAIVVGVVPTILGLFGPLGAVWLAVGGLIFGLGWIGLGIDAVRRDRRPVSAEPAAA